VTEEVMDGEIEMDPRQYKAGMNKTPSPRPKAWNTGTIGQTPKKKAWRTN
jgi:hypothetical protein